MDVNCDGLNYNVMDDIFIEMMESDEYQLFVMESDLQMFELIDVEPDYSQN